MPFVKLDCGIVNSSLWIERDVRSVFITALVMAELREFREPVPQIAVRSLELTGWIAPPGWYGFVAAAGTGIVRRDGIDDTEAGLDALEKLGSADPDSRSKAHQGRRLIRIDGGYLVLNFFEYHEHDYGGADRAKRYREKQKELREGTRDRRDVTRDERDVTRDVTQLEAEAEKEKDLTTFVPSALETCPSDTSFSTAWSLYPNRAGGNSRREAERAWFARIKAGVSAIELIEGVQRYAAFCASTGKVGTEYVKQAKAFFGPAGHWRESWVIPVSRSNGTFDVKAIAAEAERLENERHV